jgi:hypothetical protein
MWPRCHVHGGGTNSNPLSGVGPPKNGDGKLPPGKENKADTKRQPKSSLLIAQHINTSVVLIGVVLFFDQTARYT